MILYKDEHWLVVDKPVGMATHAPRPGELGAVEWLELHLGLKTHVVSRLDRETSGVLLLARDAAASARAQRIHEGGGARKVYEFISDRDAGAVGLPDEWVRDDEIDGKSACTEFRRLGAVGRYWSYRAEIARGRTHQIRRHAAASGVPILGDGEYGGTAWPRLCLHCAEVRWPEIAEPVRAGRPVSFGVVGARAVELEYALCRDRRGGWIAAVSNAWRVVHRGEIAGLPVSIDVYSSWFDAIWYDEEVAARNAAGLLEPLLTQVASTFGCRGGTVRVHRRNPHGSTLVAGLVLVGEPPPDRFVVIEHGQQYEVSLTKTQHTGLFLDQRDTRRRVAAISAGRRCANLFAYTCSFSVVAAASGAEVVFSVDTAKPCLMTGRRNFALNALAESGRGKFIQEDVRQWLERQRRKKQDNPGMYRPLDLVICDPPVFASAKDGGSFALEKEWSVLAREVADLLANDGCAIFANNHQSGGHDFYRRQLEDKFTKVIELQAPMDYSTVNRQVQHVRTFWCKRKVI